MKLNAAQELIHKLLENSKKADYKSPHAYRGTPPRLHYHASRAKAKKLAKEMYAKGLQFVQPVQYKNRGERERIAAQKQVQAEQSVGD